MLLFGRERRTTSAKFTFKKPLTMFLVQTLMQPLRSQYRGVIDKNNLRRSRYGALNLFQAQTASPQGILTADVIANIKKSMGHTIQIPVMNSETVTIGTARSCVIQDSENTSTLIGLTFIPFSFGFNMYRAQHMNNEISYQADWSRKMEKYLLAFAAALDSLCVSTANNDRNQYFTGLEGGYAVAANAMQVPGARAYDMYNQISSLMELQDFYGQYDVLANTMHKSLVRRVSSQGSGNDENDAFQFPGFDFHYSNRVPNAAGIHSTGYVIPKGTVAIENRNDPDAIMGSIAGGGSKKWSQVDMPIVNMKMGAYYNDDCKDASTLHAGTAHLTRTKVEGYEFSTDVVVMTAWNDKRATSYSPINKFEVSSAGLPQ